MKFEAMLETDSHSKCAIRGGGPSFSAGKGLLFLLALLNNHRLFSMRLNDPRRNPIQSSKSIYSGPGWVFGKPDPLD